MDTFIFDKPDGVLLSSQLSRIKIVSSDECVDVSLSDSHGRVIFSESFCPYGGEFTIYELDIIIENALRSSGESFDSFTLTVGEDSHMYKVLYCSAAPLTDDLSQWLSRNFLSTLTARRVAPSASLALFAFLEEDETASLAVSGRLRPVAGSGETVYVSTVIDPNKTASYTGVWQFNISVPDIAAALFSEADVSANDFMLVSFSVRCAQRSVECFISEELSDADTFFFRNCFGVWDCFSIPMVTVAKSVSELELARLSDNILAYNRVLSKSYESTTAPLLAEEADWIDQFFASYDVLHLTVPSADLPALAPVIITDSTCEISSNPEEPNTASFTWRYDKVRPAMFPPELPHIFSHQFDYRFS